MVYNEVYKYGRYTADQTAAHLNVIQVSMCMLIFFCRFFAVSFIILCHCVNYPMYCACLQHRQMSVVVTFHCFPTCCVTQWSVTLVLIMVGPPRRRQASCWSLFTIHSVTAGLSRSCSGFDLSPFTYDLSHCSSPQLRDLSETSQPKTMKIRQIS